MDHADLCRILGVSRETSDRLRLHGERLRHWSRALNLVAPRSLPDLWRRHFLDSAQLLEHAPPEARRWIDLGAGAGFPGLVVAILAAEQRPALRITLVESDRRKAVFLRETARVCEVAVEVVAERAEALDRRAEIVSARALAPLGALLDLATPLLTPGGVCLFLKGGAVADEIAAAETRRRFHVERLPSRAHAEGAVLRISRLAEEPV